MGFRFVARREENDSIIEVLFAGGMCFWRFHGESRVFEIVDFQELRGAPTGFAKEICEQLEWQFLALIED